LQTVLLLINKYYLTFHFALDTLDVRSFMKHCRLHFCWECITCCFISDAIGML